MKNKHISIALLMMTGSASLAAEVSELTVVSWGGSYQNSMEKAYTEPYSEMTGMNFEWDQSAGEIVNKLRLMDETGDITWDVVDSIGANAIRLCDEGLARVIDADTELANGDDGSTAAEDFGDLRVSECFVPQVVFSITWGYRTDVENWNGEVPTEICDVFDVEKFPGKRSIIAEPRSNMEWGAYCSGVPAEDVYDFLSTDAGQDAAIAKWAEIKDSLLFWNNGAITPQLLADGEVVMGTTFNGRLFTLIEENGAKNIARLWDAQVMDVDGWIIPANLPPERDAAAMAFLKFTSDTKRQADQAKYISYGPARKSSAELVGDHAELGIDMKPFMPNNPENMSNVIFSDYIFWADFQEDIDQKWAAFMSK